MALWDHFLGKGTSASSKELAPIVQLSPRPEIYSTSTETPPPAPAERAEELTAPTRLDTSGPVRPRVGHRARRPVPQPAPRPAPGSIVDSAAPAQVRDSLTWLRRGVVCQARGDHAGAIENLTKAIELDPGCGDAYEARGVSREHVGDAEGAKKDYAKAIGMEVQAEIQRQGRENPDVPAR